MSQTGQEPQTADRQKAWGKKRRIQINPGLLLLCLSFIRQQRLTLRLFLMHKTDEAVHTFHSRTQMVEIGGSEVQGHLGPHERFSQK